MQGVDQSGLRRVTAPATARLQASGGAKDVLGRVARAFSLQLIPLYRSFYLRCARCLCSPLGRDRFALADKSRGFQLENLEPFYDA